MNSTNSKKGVKSNVISNESQKAQSQKPVPFQSMERQQKISCQAHSQQIQVWTVYQYDPQGYQQEKGAEAQ